MRKALRVLIKAFFLIVLLGGGIIFANPWLQLDSFSFYNRIWRGRERFPYGMNARDSYNFNVANIDAMFAAHEVSALPPKKDDEIRIFLIGDSSVWGERVDQKLTVSERLDGRSINQAGIQKTLRVCNLGFPWVSIQRDLLIFKRALKYQPDLIIWSLTMESFLKGRIDRIEMVGGKGTEYNALAEQWGLSNRAQVKNLTFKEKRRKVFDLIRLQLAGFWWSATGVDQFWNDSYERMSQDQVASTSYYGFEDECPAELMDWDVLDAAVQMANDVPVLFVNEPIFIASGKNHEIRYNMYYPRAAYDRWRKMWHEKCLTEGFACLDLWDFLSPERFMDTPFHYDATGAALVAEEVFRKVEALYHD